MTDGRTTISTMKPSDSMLMFDAAYDALDVVTAVSDFLLVLEGRDGFIHEKSYGTYSHLLNKAHDTLEQVLSDLMKSKCGETATDGMQPTE